MPYQYVYLRELLKQRKLPHVRPRGVGVARRAEAAGEAAPRRPPPRPADQAAAAARALRRARAAEVPAGAGRPQAPAGRRPADVLAAVAAALRGPQLDGVLDGVAPAVPRPGAGRLGAAPAAVGDRRPGLEPGDPARGPARRAHREGAHPALEGRVHHPRDPLAAGPARHGAGPVPLARVLRPALLGRRRASPTRSTAFCAGEVEPSQIFWRAINTEIWLRVFFDHDGAIARRRRVPPSTSPASATRGWRRATSARPPRLAQFTPHEQRHLFAQSTSTAATMRARRSARGCS